MVKIDINITPIATQGASSKPKISLTSATILRYLIGNDEKVDNMIILGVAGHDLVTTDKEIYEAIGSIDKFDGFKPTKLSKLFEMVDVYPFRDLAHAQKPVLTFEKMDEIRKQALNLPQKGQSQESPSSKDEKQEQ